MSGSEALRRAVPFGFGSDDAPSAHVRNFDQPAVAPLLQARARPSQRFDGAESSVLMI